MEKTAEKLRMQLLILLLQWISILRQFDTELIKFDAWMRTAMRLCSEVDWIEGVFA